MSMSGGDERAPTDTDTDTDTIIPRFKQRCNRRTWKGSKTMKRYEVKRISLNWYGIWDSAKREFVIESTGYGIECYRKLFAC